ncbi:MAG: aminoacetone oxidase family FAD-binding enzyme [Ruminiclostridium sp.]|nr:aminoacetone oxidase family FAD-binding enzyme [Ruminiclostridium sp.]
MSEATQAVFNQSIIMSHAMNRFDIAIIGGGASGLAAAISAKRTNRKASVAVIERLAKTGKKLLATGNGRCNLSNADAGSYKKHYYGSCELAGLTVGFSVPDFFEGLGVLCEDDGYGRIYPRCRSAASVLDALRLECAKLGVAEICNTGITDIEIRDGFILRSEDEIFYARTVILAGGGRSQPALGSNGSLLDICAGLGITAAETSPALVPLKTEPALVKPLKGQRADANVTFFAYGKAVKSERGEVQFTDGLISGICVFDLSYLYERYKNNSELRLDLLPDMDIQQVNGLLKTTRKIRKDAPAEDYLSGIFTKPMGMYLLKRAYKKLPVRTGDIADSEHLAQTIKQLAFPITGTAGFDRSQVTAGGITDITDRFEIASHPGMYACGEILDIFGDCGGYNLDFAFSSGAIAGQNAASDLYKRQ